MNLKIGDFVRVLNTNEFGNTSGRVAKITDDRVCLTFNQLNRPDTWQWYDKNLFYKRVNDWWVR